MLQLRQGASLLRRLRLRLLIPLATPTPTNPPPQKKKFPSGEKICAIDRQAFERDLSAQRKSILRPFFNAYILHRVYFIFFHCLYSAFIRTCYFYYFILFCFSINHSFVSFFSFYIPSATTHGISLLPLSFYGFSCHYKKLLFFLSILLYLDNFFPADYKNRLFYIQDRNSNLRFLVETGAQISVIPLSSRDKSMTKPKEALLKLQAANVTPISTYGERIMSLNIGLKREFTWTLTIADVETPILGADFLAHFNLSVELSSRTLTDMFTTPRNTV
ncbi:unnamed protein product [Acanthosepion pharaonis]|uniref:Peptidase A2 domain-containing protein n=1 Tax=Acanthosepion pharaonis TaxID=158019 RepID=A0A812DP49_ACAPH|nr:unnamed protein product [Sepia pharaonis]